VILLNKKMIKEWDKIKNYGIYESIEEFKKVYDEKPYGICMRKYTAYPWSKDNFFFGSSEELNDWYKTTDEIPFFAKDYINKKYGHLTILEFDRDKENLQNGLVVKCRCDCGNTVVFEWKKVRHGDLLSCGCKSRKNSSKSSLYDAFKNMVDERWDYEKNKENPKEIPFDTEKKYWWKGYENSYLMSPKSFFDKSSGTSFPEQAILFYLKKIEKDVLNRYKIEIDSKKYEVDIYLPKYNIAIEYDGFLWHKDKNQKDIDKSLKILSKGIKIIRVRESGLEKILDKNILTIDVDIGNKTYLNYICDSINDTMELLFLLTKNQKFKERKITVETLKKDKIEIEKGYLKKYEKNNIANNWMSKFWSSNNDIENYKISCSSNDKFYFICNKKRRILISPRTIEQLHKNLNSSQKEKFVKELLIDDKCPFVDMKECPCNTFFNREISSVCSFQKNNDNSERLIFSFDNENPLYEEDDSIYRYGEYVNLSSIPVNKELDKISKFLSSFPSFYSDDLSEKLSKLFNNILYYSLDVIDEAMDMFFKVEMSNNVRKKYIEYMLHDFIKYENEMLNFCSCKEMLRFYFSNIEYEKISIDNEYYIFDDDIEENFFVKLIAFLFNDKSFNGLYIAINTISQFLDNKKFEFVVKGATILNAIKPTKTYSKIKESIKKKKELINLLGFNCFPQTQKEIEEIMTMRASDVRLKYCLKFIEYKIVNNTITRENLIRTYEKYRLYETETFFYKINELLEKYKSNDEFVKIFETERVFFERYKSENYIRGFVSRGFFDENYIPSLLCDYCLEEENEIFSKIKDYLSFFKGEYINIHIEELSNVKMVYELLLEYGLYNVYFDIQIFDDEEYVDKLFDYIEQYYDDNSLRTVNNERFVTPIWNLMKLNVLSQKFVDRMKKTMIYIQKIDRKSNSYIMASIDDDFNQLLGIDRKKLQKHHYVEYK